MSNENVCRQILILSGVLGALAVIIGAFGAHGLGQFLSDRGLEEGLVSKRVDQFETGARYHLVHTVALLAMVSMPFGSPRAKRIVAGLFVVGIFLFSGSLYVLVLSNTPVWGAVTPIGGLSWIVAWAGLIGLAKRPQT